MLAQQRHPAAIVNDARIRRRLSMKRFGYLLLVISFAGTSPAPAQNPNSPSQESSAARMRVTSPAPTLSPGELQATPEMWFYEQERQRYQDPKSAVRANAEYRAGQRARRLAALKWFGFSNSRPTANPDPFHGSYSPRWVSGGYIPSQWHGGGSSTVVIAQERLRRY
jgi:hypothetical protein